MKVKALKAFALPTVNGLRDVAVGDVVEVEDGPEMQSRVRRGWLEQVDDSTALFSAPPFRKGAVRVPAAKR